MKNRIQEMRRHYNHSIKGKVLSVAIISVIIPLMLFLITSIYSVRMIEQRIYKDNANLMQAKMKQLESQMAMISNYLLKISTDWQADSQFSSDDAAQRYFGANTYNAEMQKDIALMDGIDGLIYISYANNNYIYQSPDYNRNFTERTDVVQYLRSLTPKQLAQMTDTWSIVQIGSNNELIYLVPGSKVCFFAWISFDTLMNQVEKWEMPENTKFCFVSSDGKLLTEIPEGLNGIRILNNTGSYYLAGPNNRYLITSIGTTYGAFRLLCIVNKRQVLSSFYYLRDCGIIIIFLLMIILIPTLVKSLDKSIFSPIFKIENGMQKVVSGNQNVNLENTRSSTEMEHLTSSFNAMTAQIKNLTEKAYNAGVQYQELQMDYLRLQIEPHAYLNSLNLINAMAQAGDTGLIEQFTRQFSVYLRHLISVRNTNTTIRKEMELVDSYIEMLKIRFSDSFQFSKEIDESSMNIIIPPCMIETVIENTIKHAFNMYERTSLELKIKRKFDANSGNIILISIKDNGGGYSKEYIEQFSTGIKPADGHIGLWNVRERLFHMYPGECSFRIYDIDPHGAGTEITIWGKELNESIDCR